MLLENTVTPWSTLVADKTRIAGFMGNRGILHDTTRSIVKRWTHKSWVFCATSYKGIDRRPLFRTDPFRYSELFFLDEATAYAAGHRPCNYCRREALVLFKTIWCAVNRTGVPPNSVQMSEIDTQLHSERVVRGGSKVRYTAPMNSLPFGTMFEHDHSAYLIGKQAIYLWSASGYHPAELAPASEVHVLTPASVVASFSHGLKPQVHDSVSK